MGGCDMEGAAEAAGMEVPEGGMEGATMVAGMEVPEGVNSLPAARGGRWAAAAGGCSCVMDWVAIV